MHYNGEHYTRRAARVYQLAENARWRVYTTRQLTLRFVKAQKKQKKTETANDGRPLRSACPLKPRGPITFHASQWAARCLHDLPCR